MRHATPIGIAPTANTATGGTRCVSRAFVDPVEWASGERTTACALEVGGATPITMSACRHGGERKEMYISY